MKSLLSFLFISAFSASAAVIQIDLGYDTTTASSVVTDRKTLITGWNNSYWNGTAPTSITGLVTSTGDSTAYNFAVSTNGFIGGAETANALVGNPATAYADSLYGTSTASVLTLSNLDPTLSYSFKFYSAVNRSDSVNRTSRFVINGNQVEINSYNNNGNWTNTISGITPDVNGNINITVSRGTGNTGSSYLLNILHMETAPIPEPTTALLSVIGLTSLLRRRR